jgi:glycosyltransferase involved in cell wall biosynthesis
MKILYISNDYGYSKVHYNLCTHFDAAGVEQLIFVPLNIVDKNLVNSNLIDFTTDVSRIVYYSGLKNVHRIAFGAKIKKIVTAFQKQFLHEVSSIDLIHAVTLCSDGAVAFRLWQKYKIPYIVSIRNTDINTHYKYRYWYRGLFHKILLNASAVIFISPSYQYTFLNEVLPSKIAEQIKHKATCIPNGINSHFLDSRCMKAGLKKEINLVYVGGVNKNKNIHSVVESIRRIREEYHKNITFTVIGKGMKDNGYYPRFITRLAQKYSEWFKVLEKQDSQTLMVSLRGYDIFVMSSIHETFGLVYIEALSQGLPIIYTKGQGIDGYYKDGCVGFPVQAENVEDITKKILLVINNYPSIINNIAALDLGEFEWEAVAETYLKIYRNTIGHQIR